MTLERAVQAMRDRQWERAIAACDAVLAQNPGCADAHHLRGIALSESGKPREALTPLNEAISSAPDNPIYLASLALTWRKLGDNERATQCYERAMQFQPDQPQWLYQLGLARAELGQAKRAENAFRQALKLQPGLVGALAALARLFESMGDQEQAEEAAIETLRQDPSNSSARLTLADVWVRKGEARAVPLLQSISDDAALPPADRAIAYAKLGRLFDNQERYDEAWAAFEAGNSLLRPAVPTLAPSVYGLDHIDSLRQRFAAQHWRDWPQRMPAGSGKPVFLVGFPRSGTTLLERMLSMHPQITQLDEKQTLREALTEAANQNSELYEWQDPLVEELRNAYWRNVDHYLGRQRQADEVIVDKLPLNSLHLEMIYRLFPEATILFAVRDPRDVVLSCFMQSFGLNDAMANFLAIESAVTYYVRSMTLALQLKAELPMAFIDVRYESLIAQPESVLRPALSALELAWSPEILNYHRTGNELVNTPSYQQIEKPLYDSSVGRWKHYLPYLNDAYRPLRPLVGALGYD